MAKTVLLADGKRSGGLVQEFALPNGKPMMIKLTWSWKVGGAALVGALIGELIGRLF